MVWHYKYKHDPETAKPEKEARAAKIGLWSQPHPVPPWDFRRIINGNGIRY